MLSVCWFISPFVLFLGPNTQKRSYRYFTPTTTFNLHDRGIMSDMNMKTTLEQAMKDAMLAGDDLRKRTLRLALASIKNAEIEKRGELEENEILAILSKEVKTRHESIEDAKRAGRDSQVEIHEEEISVLNEYLPEALSPDELESMAREAIEEAGATTPGEMGKVMQILMPRVQGRADGKEVSQIVRQLLSA